MQRVFFFVIVAVIVYLPPKPASAYFIDPMTGSIIINALIAGAISAAAYVKIHWHRINAWFKSTRRKNSDTINIDRADNWH